MKKYAVVYASKTGNTKKVAEALVKAAPDQFDMFDAADKPDLSAYELVAFGYGVDKGGPYAQCRDYMATISNKAVVLFQTLGAEGMGEHAMACAANGGMCLGKGNHILGFYSCQGAIDPKLIEAMRKMPAGPHSATPENEKRWAAAASHPDAQDLEKATAFMQHMISVYENYFKKMMAR